MPQSTHMYVDEISCGRNKLVIPDFLEQHCPCQQLIASPHHVFKETEFTRQEINLALAAPRRSLDEIEFQRPDPQRRLTGVRGTTKEGFYSCNEFDDCKRLRKIVVSAAS